MDNGNQNKMIYILFNRDIKSVLFLKYVRYPRREIGFIPLEIIATSNRLIPFDTSILALINPYPHKTTRTIITIRISFFIISPFAHLRINAKELFADTFFRFPGL